MIDGKTAAQYRALAARARAYVLFDMNMDGEAVNLGYVIDELLDEVNRLRSAMQRAIACHEQPNYGDNDTRMDNSADAINLLRETMP